MKAISENFHREIEKIATLADTLPFENKSFLFKWMCQQYYLVRTSTRYVAFAASRVEPTHSLEFRQWVSHLTEEVDHDLGLLKDIKKISSQDIEEIYPATRALIGATYYDIEKNGPNALLGYALLLEGLSCARCAKIASRLKAAHGFNSAYLNLHAQVDQEHFPEGLKSLESLDTPQKKVVVDNLHMSARMYQFLLSEVCRDANVAIDFTKAA